jgi:chromosome partitioning protein
MILSFTSSKGGVGKSTSCAAIACALAGQGEAVEILDLDPNKTLDRWHRNTPHAGVNVVHCEPQAFREKFEAAQATGRHVLIDLAGFLHTDILRAFTKADLVIIPATPSEPDVHEAMRMAKHVRGVGGSVDREIPFRVLLTQVGTLRTKAGDFVTAQVDAAGLPRFMRGMVSRIAYKEMFLTGEAPTDVSTETGAGAEVAAILDEIRAIIDGKQARRVAGAA